METLSQTMDRVRQHTDLKAYCDAHLEARPRDGRDRYVCPVCGSGTGKNHKTGTGDAAFHLYVNGRGETRWHCSACGGDGDAFDLAGYLNNETDRAAQCNLVAEWAGVEGWHRDEPGGTADTWRDWDGAAIDRGEPLGWDAEAKAEDAPGPTPTTQATPGAGTAKQGSGGTAGEQQQTDYAEGRARHREYIRQAQASIGHPDALAYLASRGIDLETAQAWGLGYDPNPKHGWQDENKQWHRSGRIVIPWAGTDYYHIDRATDGRAKSLKYDKPSTPEVGQQPLWNPGALRAKAFFVVEGALDALAVQACGYEAVAMGTAKANDLIEAMRETRGVGMALFLNDNDRAGLRAQAELAEGMRAAGLAFFTVDVAEMGAKDAAEKYAEDREGLASFLKAAYRDGMAGAHAAALASLGVYDPATVTESLYTMADVLAPIPTGLARIDNAIGGGLPARGLVVIGAVSSAGKTSLVHQICDNVAASGRPVLFCSIEQGRQEVVAKSLSRIMATMGRANGGRIVASAQAITNRAERERWEREDAEKSMAFTAACNVYHQRTHREDGTPTLYIMEAERQPSVADVRRAAEAIRDVHGQAPLVAVDYVQLLGAPAGLERGTDKQILDRNTLELRQMARDLPTCVMAISSLNRASYTGSIELSSFKESGMLEYSSDLLLGLQPEGLHEAMRGKSEDSGAAKAKVRQIWREYKEAQQKQVEIVVLKNRNGGISKSPCLTFDGMVSTFSEAGPARAAKPTRL